jgi:hypothetical protein
MSARNYHFVNEMLAHYLKLMFSRRVDGFAFEHKSMYFPFEAQIIWNYDAEFD